MKSNARVQLLQLSYGGRGPLDPQCLKYTCLGQIARFTVCTLRWDNFVWTLKRCCVRTCPPLANQ